MSIESKKALARLVRALKQTELAWRAAGPTGSSNPRVQQMEAELNAATADAEGLIAGDGGAIGPGPEIPEEAVQAIEAAKKLAKKCGAAIAKGHKAASLEGDNAVLVAAIKTYEKSIAPARAEEDEEEEAEEDSPAEAAAE